MEIKIVSANEAKEITAWQPNYWNIISIGSLNDGYPKLVNARDLIKLNFDDFDDKVLFWPDIKATLKKERAVMPEPREIIKGIEFGRKYLNGPLLIHCFAGISRSAAMGWLILFDKFRDVELATHLLFKTRRCALPNSRVIRLGVEYLTKSAEERKDILKKLVEHPDWIKAHNNEGVVV